MRLWRYTNHENGHFYFILFYFILNDNLCFRAVDMIMRTTADLTDDRWVGGYSGCPYRLLPSTNRTQVEGRPNDSRCVNVDSAIRTTCRNFLIQLENA